MTTEKHDIDDLHFYCVEAELHGVSWFSSTTAPHEWLKLFAQSCIPVIHNLPLMLALNGQISDESYISCYRLIKRPGPPAERFSELEVYAYPLQLSRVYYRSILFSMAETDYIFYKPQTRAAVPVQTRYTVMTPGTEGWTAVISREKLPRELYVRIGVKRFGTWKLVLEEASPSIVDGSVVKVDSPFNTLDTRPADYAGSPVVVLKHYAGDIAVSGLVKRALKLRCREKTILKPLPFFL